MGIKGESEDGDKLGAVVRMQIIISMQMLGRYIIIMSFPSDKRRAPLLALENSPGK